MSEESLVFGLHSVRTLLQQRPERASKLLLQKGRDDARVNEIVQLARAANVKIEYRDVAELDRLSSGDRHQGACLQMRPAAVLGEGALDELLDPLTVPPLLLVLDGVQDPPTSVLACERQMPLARMPSSFLAIARRGFRLRCARWHRALPRPCP